MQRFRLSPPPAFRSDTGIWAALEQYQCRVHWQYRHCCRRLAIEHARAWQRWRREREEWRQG